MHYFVQKAGFIGILLCASIPNPLFDLAGLTCGHFLVRQQRHLLQLWNPFLWGGTKTTYLFWSDPAPSTPDPLPNILSCHADWQSCNQGPYPSSFARRCHEQARL